MVMFLNPSALWFSLFIPLVVLLYFLKLRRKKTAVSSILLWEQVLRDQKANQFFQKPKKNLLLLLQLLLLLLLITALAEPVTKAAVEGGQDIVLVIDSSASMNARDVEPSRFEAARREALRIIDGLGRGDEAMIIQAASKPEITLGFTGDKAKLRQALGSLVPTHAPASVGDAVTTALALLEKRPGPSRIIIISDGGGVETLPEGDMNTEVRFIGVGRQSRNLGITAIDVRKSLRSNFDYEVFTAVQNFGDAEEDFTLRVFLDEELVDARSLSLPPGASRSLLVRQVILSPGEHVVKVLIDGEDYLEADNAAYAVISQGNLSVLLVTQGNVFLEKALGVQGVELARVAPSEYPRLAPKALSYDILVFDGYSPEPESLRNYRGGLFFINSVAEGYAPVRLLGVTEAPLILDWDRAHPLMRFVDLSEVRIARSLKVETLSWGRTLAEAQDTPLLVVGEKENRAAFLGFDLHDSDLPLRISFPILVSNAVSWLGAGRVEELGIQNPNLRAGEAVLLRASGAREVSIHGPGEELTLTLAAGESLAYEPRRVGLYTLAGDGPEKKFAVNLLNAEESNITPASGIGREGEIKSEAVVKANRELWRLFALAALLVLAAEWYVYHRGL